MHSNTEIIEGSQSSDLFSHFPSLSCMIFCISERRVNSDFPPTKLDSDRQTDESFLFLLISKNSIWTLQNKFLFDCIFVIENIGRSLMSFSLCNPLEMLE